MGKRKQKPPRRRRKVALPCDRTGEPIQVGDVLEWGDGTRMRVSTLTYFGRGYKAMGNAWTADDEDGGFSDNLGASLVVWRGGDR